MKWLWTVALLALIASAGFVSAEDKLADEELTTETVEDDLGAARDGSRTDLALIRSN